MKKTIIEDEPTNNAGSGNIAGIGVGPQGEPGGNVKRLLKLMLRRNRTNVANNGKKRT